MKSPADRAVRSWSTSVPGALIAESRPAIAVLVTGMAAAIFLWQIDQVLDAAIAAALSWIAASAATSASVMRMA